MAERVLVWVSQRSLTLNRNRAHDHPAAPCLRVLRNGEVRPAHSIRIAGEVRLGPDRPEDPLRDGEQTITLWLEGDGEIEIQ